jgi:D-amino-acid dehydrogenase
MNVIVMGAGIIGVSTAWHLLEQGHAVTVIDRQADAAMETSFANGAQISVGYCEPWAGAQTPWKVAKWLLDDESPLLFRPRLDVQQWRWGWSFLTQCNDAAFERNLTQLIALGRYSHETLKQMVASTGIDYDRLQRGILYFYATQQDLDAAASGAELMRRLGVERRVLTRDEVLQTEPSLRHATVPIAGGTFSPGDESGDARVFTQELARRCAERGARFLYRHEVTGFDTAARRVQSMQVIERDSGRPSSLAADAFVAALGSFTAPLLRPLGIHLAIYPTKGYSATLRLRRPQDANVVSLIDDTRKIAVSRLGDQVRIAGTAELAGYDTTLTSRTARARCASLVRRYEALFPGVADTREPNFWAGLRPSTPGNVPLIGRSALHNLWINAGHGTLGWTHGAGSGRALAELMSGRRPAIAFGFLGEEPQAMRRIAAA